MLVLREYSIVFAEVQESHRLRCRSRLQMMILIPVLAAIET